MTQKIKTFNAIAEKGLNILQEKKFEVSDGLSDPDAIILRSHKLKKEDFLGPDFNATSQAAFIPAPNLLGPQSDMISLLLEAYCSRERSGN